VPSFRRLNCKVRRISVVDILGKLSLHSHHILEVFLLADLFNCDSKPPSLTKPASGCKFALSEYFWLNNLHPTYPVHDATAAELGKYLAKIPANNGKKCGFVVSNEDAGGQYHSRIMKRERWRL
jgi:hypothetical protein